MAKSDGEYELVLGNRQLLSAFFVVVILFALFFTMGYIVGRNSASAMATLTSTGPASATAKPATTVPTSTPEPSRETASELPNKAEHAAAESEKPPAPSKRAAASAVEKGP